LKDPRDPRLSAANSFSRSFACFAGKEFPKEKANSFAVSDGVVRSLYAMINDRKREWSMTPPVIHKWILLFNLFGYGKNIASKPRCRFLTLK